MYHFGFCPSNSVVLLLAVGQAAHLVGPCCCVLVVIGLILAGAAGVLHIGRTAVHPAVDAALLCPGGVNRHCHTKIILYGGKEVVHLA